nr:MAG TPA: hypothetical protein [Microviridae sp.]
MFNLIRQSLIWLPFLFRDGDAVGSHAYKLKV